MKRIKKTKTSKLHILTIQTKSGVLLKIKSSSNYDTLLLEGMQLAKKLNGFWTMYDVRGREIDGNFTPIGQSAEKDEPLRTNYTEFFAHDNGETNGLK